VHSYDVARHEKAQRLNTRMEAIAPKKLCRKQALIKGCLPVSDFPRYSQLGRSSGSVEFRLDFAYNELGQANVKGEARNEISLVCQRCLVEVSHELVTQIDLVIVTSEEHARELVNLDSVVVEEDTVALVDLLEDDLILGVPEQVCPNPDACKFTPQFQFSGGIVEKEKPSPFEILGILKSDKN